MENFAKISLKIHNQYRSLHQADALTWCPELAKEAKEWAIACCRSQKLQHASKEERHKAGENLSELWGSLKPDQIARLTVQMWYEEEEKYQYQKPGFDDSTGHFTQVVWKGTQKVGMDWAQSSDGKTVFVVARYLPAGNVRLAFKENVLAPVRR